MIIAISVVVIALILTFIVWIQVVHRMVAPQIEADVTCTKASIPFEATTDIIVTLRNPTRLPCPVVHCEVALPKDLLRANTTKPASFALSMGPREVARICFRVRGTRRGQHRIQLINLVISDGFTSRQTTRSFSCFVTLTVHPRRVELKQIVNQFSRLGMFHSSRKLSPTSIDWFDLRPYAVGDSLRDVSWMTSARRGELIVLERAFSMSQFVVLVASVQASELSWESKANYADKLYETAFSMIESLAKNGVQVYLYSDGYHQNALRRSRNQLALDTHGIWNAHLRHRAGHILGGMLSHPVTSTTQILSELDSDLQSPARIIILLADEKYSQLQPKMQMLRRKGHVVEVVRVPSSASVRNSQGEVLAP